MNTQSYGFLNSKTLKHVESTYRHVLKLIWMSSCFLYKYTPQAYSSSTVYSSHPYVSKWRENSCPLLPSKWICWVKGNSLNCHFTLLNHLGAYPPGIVILLYSCHPRCQCLTMPSQHPSPAILNGLNHIFDTIEMRVAVRKAFFT